MIGKQELKNIRIYIVYFCLLLVLFFYAAETGWRIYSTDEVEHSGSGQRSGSRTRFYHK